MSDSTGNRGRVRVADALAKVPSGIRGFDQLTDGSLPRGRPTLVTGASGSGKTLFAIEFLLRGARELGEPGVLLTFEESAGDLTRNVASLGFDLAQLEQDGLQVIDDYGAPTTRVSTGLGQLDQLLGGGIYSGSMAMISGSAGTGKTTLAAQIVDAACARGERALFVSFEESPDQLVRDLRSVGIDLGRWFEAGLLQMWSERATAHGLESHLGRLERLLDETNPAVVALDAVGSLGRVGTPSEVTSAVTREIDLIKSRGLTGVLTTLTHEPDVESSAVAVSSLIDTWLLLRNSECDGERNRLLFVIKSRGTAHSNQVREFVLTDHGPELLEVVVGPQGVATGSARAALLAADRASADDRREELEQRRGALARRATDVDAQIAVLRAQVAAESAELDRLAAQMKAAPRTEDPR